MTDSERLRSVVPLDKAHLNESCVWSKVPVEITARVLSLLPVPDLCVCRSVCKTWNELLRQPDFLTLCHRKDAYLFVTGHLSNKDSSWVHDAYRRTPCFFDLENQRWLSIPVDATGAQHNVAQLLAMDDGLICELSVAKNEFQLVMLDPVAKTRLELPSLLTGDDEPVLNRLAYDAPPAIVTVVEDDDCTFQVFLISSRALGAHTGFFLYESKTNAWRDLGNPVQELRRLRQTEPHLLPTAPVPVSAKPDETTVYFQGNLYATFYVLASKTVLLLSYNLQTNSWKEVLTIASTTPGYPSLTVIHNRMFMAMWVTDESSQTRNNTTRSMFEITELFVNRENRISSRNSVVRISYVDVKRMFYGALPVHNEFGLQYDIAFGFPVDEELSSVVLVSRQTGKMILYDLGSKCVAALPEHPWRQACLEVGREDVLPVTFRAKFVNLSFRNVLSVCCHSQERKLF